MSKRKHSKWTLSYGAIGGLIGVSIGGGFDISVVLGGLSAALLLIVINVLIVRKKSDRTPEYDERTITNMQKFYFYASTIFIFLLMFVLGLMSAFGIDSISTSYLFLAIFSYLAISGVIALIISKK